VVPISLQLKKIILQPLDLRLNRMIKEEEKKTMDNRTERKVNEKRERGKGNYRTRAKKRKIVHQIVSHLNPRSSSGGTPNCATLVSKRKRRKRSSSENGTLCTKGKNGISSCVSVEPEPINANWYTKLCQREKEENYHQVKMEHQVL